MGMTIKTVGLDAAVKFTENLTPLAEKNLRKGIISAALLFEAACTREITALLYSKPEAPDKPRKRTGNLRASRFTVWSGGSSNNSPSFKAAEGPIDEGYSQSLQEANSLVNTGSSFAACVGYGAYYALYVHESAKIGIAWMTSAYEKVREKMNQVVLQHTGELK